MIDSKATLSKKEMSKAVKMLKKQTRPLKTVMDYYTNLLARNMGSSIDELMFGKVIKYRREKIIKYLHLPIPVIEYHFDNDSEFGDGSFEGLLLSVRWINTHIPIGSEVIEVPVRRKLKGTIKFRRYSPLKITA